ncbi:MAG: hypothetical protein JWM53_11 [bacterium]|nr:hypothetical protein [bacterium]
MRIAIVLVFVAAGCHAGPIYTPPPPRPDASCPEVCITAGTPVTKADVLFVLDNAPSMNNKLAKLRVSLPRFIEALDAHADLGAPVSYHFGVVTADLGAGPQPIDAFRCRPNGDGGALRDRPAADAQPAAACSALTLGNGLRFIDYDQHTGSSNIGGGLDVTTALTCLTEVGSAGCEFRQPLEAAYRALHDQVAENQAFLRSDALLVVAFVSDADDCSAVPTTDLFDGSAAAVASFGPLDRFRCTQFGISCNGQPVPPRSVSGLTGCSSRSEADGGKLTDVQRYIDFLTRPAAQGGVKVDPDNVIAALVAAPRDPVNVTVVSPCPDASGVASCPVLNHSCLAVNDATLFGDPAVRLGGVVSWVRHNNVSSICDGDDTAAIDSLGDLIVSATGGGCFQSAIANRADGTPDCVVEDVTANVDGSTTTREIPSCADNGHVVPCWQLLDKLPQYTAQGCTPPGTPPPTTCKLPASCQPVTNPLDGSMQLDIMSVDRGTDSTGKPNTAPPGTTAAVSCAQVVH